MGCGALAFIALLLSAVVLSSGAATPTPASPPDNWVPLEATALSVEEDTRQAWWAARMAPVYLVTSRYTVGTATFTVNYVRVGLVEPGDRYTLFTNPSDYRQAVDSAGRTRVLAVRAAGVLLLLVGAYGLVWVVRQQRISRQTGAPTCAVQAGPADESAM